MHEKRKNRTDLPLVLCSERKHIPQLGEVLGHQIDAACVLMSTPILEVRARRKLHLLEWFGGRAANWALLIAPARGGQLKITKVILTSALKRRARRSDTSHETGFVAILDSITVAIIVAVLCGTLNAPRGRRSDFREGVRQLRARDCLDTRRKNRQQKQQAIHPTVTEGVSWRGNEGRNGSEVVVLGVSHLPVLSPGPYAHIFTARPLLSFLSRLPSQKSLPSSSLLDRASLRLPPALKGGSSSRDRSAAGSNVSVRSSAHDRRRLTHTQKPPNPAAVA